MNRISRRSVLLAAVAAGSVAVMPRPGHAVIPVACVNCSESATQLLEYAEQVYSVVQQLKDYALQIKQYENMVLNTISLPQQLWRDISGDISEIQRLANIGALLAGDAGSITGELSRFNSAADEVLNLSNMADKYQTWARMAGQNITTYQKAVSKASDQIRDNDRLATDIQSASSSAVGAKQAIQATNEFLAVQIQETQSLHETLMGSSQAIIAYNDGLAHRQALADKSMLNFLDGDLLPTSGGKRY